MNVGFYALDPSVVTREGQDSCKKHRIVIVYGKYLSKQGHGSLRQ